MSKLPDSSSSSSSENRRSSSSVREQSTSCSTTEDSSSTSSNKEVQDSCSSSLGSSSFSQSQQQSSSSSSSGSGGSHGSHGSQSTLPASEHEPLTEDEDSQAKSWAWGQLRALKECYEDIELVKDFIHLGRGRSSKEEEQNYVFNHDIFPPEANDKFFLVHSTHHCKIIKEGVTVSVKDSSMNGTYINGSRIGSGGVRQIQHGDCLGFGMKDNNAYIFLNLEKQRRENDALPQGFKDKYELLEELLGRGACGEVRLGRFLATPDRKIAIKMIKKQASLSGAESKIITDYEAQLMMALNHPCVVKIYDVFDTDEMLYIVLEYVAGGELFDRVKKGQTGGKPVSESMVKFWMRQMLLTVKYLHTQGVTHRDLKPENILLCSKEDDECCIKVTDFGMSRFVGSASFMQTCVGTPHYIAPEILQAKSTVSGRYSKECDSWSLGCILFVCLSGYQPFSEEGTDVSLTQQILLGKPRWISSRWKNVSSQAKDLVRKFLIVDPAHRISLDDALVHPWLQDEELSAKVERAMYPLKRIPEEEERPSKKKKR